MKKLYWLPLAVLLPIFTVAEEMNPTLDGDGCPHYEPGSFAGPPLANELPSGVSSIGSYCSSSDGGQFDHVGQCYRQISLADGVTGANQCCYTNGLNNNTGSWDEVGCAMGSWPNGSCTYEPFCVPLHCLADVQPYCCQAAQSHTFMRNEYAYDNCMQTGPFDSCQSMWVQLFPGMTWDDCPKPPEEPYVVPDSGGGGGNPGEEVQLDDNGTLTCGQCWGTRFDNNDTYYGTFCSDSWIELIVACDIMVLGT